MTDQESSMIKPIPCTAQVVAVESADTCEICSELEALLQARRSLGAGAAPLGIALEYIARGWAVIPVPYRCKRPLMEDWQELRITEETAPQWFNGSDMQNVGVRLGELSGGLADVDLDTAQVAPVPISSPPHYALAGPPSRAATGSINPIFGRPKTRPRFNSNSPLAKVRPAPSR
jgi:hypothetical protein